MGGKTMLKKIKTLIAVAALSGTVGANVQAAEITVPKDNVNLNLSQVHNASVINEKWSHLSIPLIHMGNNLNIPTEKHYKVKQGDTLMEIAQKYNVSVNRLILWNTNSSLLIHQGLDLVIYVNPKIQEITKVGEQGNVISDSSATKTAVADIPVSTIISREPTPEVEKQSPENSAVQQAEPSQPKEAVQQTEPTPQTVIVKQAKPVQQTEPATQADPVQSETKSNEKQSAPENTDSKEITVKATAYTSSCEGCSGVTKTGVNLKENPDAKVIAVDPSVIPLGSKVLVEGYGVATAADTGGAIKGNRVDVFMPNQSDAIEFGAKEVTVKILN